MSGIFKVRDMKYGVYEYGYLQVHHLFWCWCRGRVAQEQHCFSHCCHYSDNFHQPWLGQQKSAKKVVKGSFYTLTFIFWGFIGHLQFVTVQYKKAVRVMQKRLSARVTCTRSVNARKLSGGGGKNYTLGTWSQQWLAQLTLCCLRKLTPRCRLGVAAPLTLGGYSYSSVESSAPPPPLTKAAAAPALAGRGSMLSVSAASLAVTGVLPLSRYPMFIRRPDEAVLRCCWGSTEGGKGSWVDTQ